jgi:hypothetical protein
MKQKSQKNKASFLLLPMLGPNQSYFDWSGLFVNCYIKDNNYPEYDNHIILLFQYPEIINTNDLNKIINIENVLYNDLSHLFVKRYEPDTKNSVHIYKVPEEYQNDYDWFRYSKYSKMSSKYKNKVLTFHQGYPMSGLLGILSRSQIMLQNVHKNLGCLNDKRCVCNYSNYLNCKHFNNYYFNFKEAEVWSAINKEEVLDIKIQEHKQIIIK